VTEVTLHPTPRERDVVREQIRIVGLGLRREALVVAIVMGIITLLVSADIVRGRAETWFDSADWYPLGIIAFLVPFAVWRRERRFGPSFLWTLPVDRRRLALARVFAGWVWVMAALAVFVLWQLVLALVAGVTGAEIIPFISCAGVTALYLFGSAVVLGLRHPLRWLLGTAGLFFLLGAFNQRVDALLSDRPFLSALHDAATSWQTLEGVAQGATTAFLWIGAGLAALWAALARHGENRRH
jgi:hypothetical protein